MKAVSFMIFLSAQKGLTRQQSLRSTKKDKKMEQGQIKFVLMKGIGSSFIDRSVSDEELLEGIREDP